MNLAEDIKPISYVKAHAAEIIEKMAENHRPIIITQNGEAKAVLTDIETYQRQQETMAMLKMVALRERDIEESGGIPHEEAKKHFREYFRELKSKR
ncbi:MAG TPA: type II toxin-antitoxin system Phd/YefM family antitoxin [Turneriella sp.]|nr:type II toxin-antitoxin system Phd/YefM family antitoxin [Turneriella sp.]